MINVDSGRYGKKLSSSQPDTLNKYGATFAKELFTFLSSTVLFWSDFSRVHMLQPLSLQ